MDTKHKSGWTWIQSPNRLLGWACLLTTSLFVTSLMYGVGLPSASAQELPAARGVVPARIRGAIVQDEPFQAPRRPQVIALGEIVDGIIEGNQDQIVDGIEGNQDEEDGIQGQADGGDEKRFPNGATLQTNPDIEDVLRKAQRYMDEGNYRAASRFWQAAIQRAGDQLYSTDGEIYFPLVRKIEEIIAKLPPDGLSTYRIAADAEATELLADDGETELSTRLQRVVDLAFLSSQGDQAALELASHYLDRFQAVPAEMLLRRILDVYPDTRVPLDEVWMKLAVTYAISGDRQRGEVALAEARRLRATVTPSLLDQIEAMLQTTTQAGRNGFATSGGKNWTSVLGAGSQIEEMPDLPAEFYEFPLVPVWMFQHHFLGNPRGKFIDGEVLEGLDAIKGAKFPLTTQDKAFEVVCREWQRNGWQATSMPLLFDGKIVFKTQADLSVWATEPLQSEALLRSLHLNRYWPDEVSKFILHQSDQNRRNFPAAANMPYTSIETLQYFGDPLFQSMAIHNGVVYSVEGENFSREAVYKDSGGRPVNAWSSPPTRDRTTYLSAYDLATGRTLWNKPFPLQEEGHDLAGAAIVGPPVGFQDSVLVPVLASSRFYLIAVDGTTGKAKWKRVICDLPQLQPKSTTLVQLAVSGSDVFMVCGCGVLANVDAGSGQLRWVRRYQRSIREMDAEGPNQQFFGRLNQDWQRYRIEGWNHDFAAIWGNWVVVAATDTNFLAGYRRSTGELVWQAPRADVLGCTVDQWLGVRDGIVYATGPRGLIAYEMAAEGRLYGTPQRLDRPISGRGIITSRGILLPVQDHLELYDLRSLAKIKDISVSMPTGMPIGSLISDGSRLWIAAMNRLIAVEPTSPVGQAEEAKQAEEARQSEETR